MPGALLGAKKLGPLLSAPDRPDHLHQPDDPHEPEALRKLRQLWVGPNIPSCSSKRHEYIKALPSVIEEASRAISYGIHKDFE